MLLLLRPVSITGFRGRSRAGLEKIPPRPQEHRCADVKQKIYLRRCLASALGRRFREDSVPDAEEVHEREVLGEERAHPSVGVVWLGRIERFGSEVLPEELVRPAEPH